ncbi:hypothetical protein POTOM_040035 [Populus tomentosa]|uniref:Uncharacterized protein n=1 Tax=Populus tomentosa TaxID=118781 RepID=A0A8X7YUV7_POPTO|nr:hypothetical protein POTOM_040035 [Populus tomentosa]
MVLKDQYRILGENVARVKPDLMKEQLATFSSQLEEFARKHKFLVLMIFERTLLSGQFHEMCAKVGVDPLASSKGFWAELLQIGDFYYELGLYNFFFHYGAISLANVFESSSVYDARREGVQILEICLATRPRNGGFDQSARTLHPASSEKKR